MSGLGRSASPTDVGRAAADRIAIGEFIALDQPGTARAWALVSSRKSSATKEMMSRPRTRLL